MTASPLILPPPTPLEYDEATLDRRITAIGISLLCDGEALTAAVIAQNILQPVTRVAPRLEALEPTIRRLAGTARSLQVPRVAGNTSVLREHILHAIAQAPGTSAYRLYRDGAVGIWLGLYAPGDGWDLFEGELRSLVAAGLVRAPEGSGRFWPTVEVAS